MKSEALDELKKKGLIKDYAYKFIDRDGNIVVDPPNGLRSSEILIISFEDDTKLQLSTYYAQLFIDYEMRAEVVDKIGQSENSEKAQVSEKQTSEKQASEKQTSRPRNEARKALRMLARRIKKELIAEIKCSGYPHELEAEMVLKYCDNAISAKTASEASIMMYNVSKMMNSPNMDIELMNIYRRFERGLCQRSPRQACKLWEFPSTKRVGCLVWPVDAGACPIPCIRRKQ